MRELDILRDIELTDCIFEMKDLVITIDGQRSIMELKLSRMRDTRNSKEVSQSFKDMIHKTQMANHIKGLQIKKINVHILKLSGSSKSKKVDTRRLNHIARVESQMSTLRNVIKDLLGFDKYVEIMKEAERIEGLQL
jgi:hypothetical protein